MSKTDEKKIKLTSGAKRVIEILNQFNNDPQRGLIELLGELGTHRDIIIKFEREQILKHLDIDNRINAIEKKILELERR